MAILVFLVREALPGLQAIAPTRYLTDPSWHPDHDAARGRFNLVPMLAGSGLLTLGAVALAAPIGVLSAVFCRFYAPPRVAGPYRRVIEILAGVPSVVYGFWALVTLVPVIRAIGPPGHSLLAGMLVLALMIVPTVALLTESALRAVPRATLAGAAALGMGRSATVWGLAVPVATPGIATGILLATARAVGETMAVLMVCGNVVQVPDSMLAPVRALTANIALEMAYAAGDHRAALFVSGLALMIAVSGLVLLVDRIRGDGRAAI